MSNILPLETLLSSIPPTIGITSQYMSQSQVSPKEIVRQRYGYIAIHLQDRRIMAEQRVGDYTDEKNIPFILVPVAKEIDLLSDGSHKAGVVQIHLKGWQIVPLSTKEFSTSSLADLQQEIQRILRARNLLQQ